MFKSQVKQLLSNWKTVPNLLSFLRILMVPAFIVFFMHGMIGWAVLMLVLSGLSDFFDGKIARRFNQISDLGKILDPLADKLTQISIAVVLLITFHRSTDPTIKAFSYAFIVFLAKEALMVIGSVILLSLNLRPGAAEMPGKIATFAFYLIMIAIIAFGPEIGVFNSIFTIPTAVMIVLVTISIILTLIAFCSYMPGVAKQLKERKAGNAAADAKQKEE